MSVRCIMLCFFYFIIEDEGMFVEVFNNFEIEVYVIVYKVDGIEDVFVMMSEMCEVFDCKDVFYNLLVEEDVLCIVIYYLLFLIEEFLDFEDVIKVLVLVYCVIVVVCVGVNGEFDFGFDLSEGVKNYIYFMVFVGYIFIFCLFIDCDEVYGFFDKFMIGDIKVFEWVEVILFEIVEDLVSFY